MKKKTMVLGGLIAAVAITGYSVAGTYAKYVSSSSFNNSARVAQWDLGDVSEVRLFTPSYDDKATSLLGDNIIAPGTSGSYEFSIAGTSEVKSEITVSVDNTKSHSIKGGYDPLKFKLSKKDNDGNYTTVADWDTFTALTTAINTISAGDFKIEWKWEFNVDDATDIKDTKLGNDIYKALSNATDYRDAVTAFKTADDAYKTAKENAEAVGAGETEAAELETAKNNLKTAQDTLDTARKAVQNIEDLSVVLYVTVTATQVQ